MIPLIIGLTCDCNTLFQSTGARYSLFQSRDNISEAPPWVSGSGNSVWFWSEEEVLRCRARGSKRWLPFLFFA